MQRHRKLQTSARKVQKHTGRRRQGELSSFETAGGAFKQRLYAQLNINRSETMRRRRSCAFGSPLASVPGHAYKLSVKNSASWVRTHLVAAETNLHAELPKRSNGFLGLFNTELIFSSWNVLLTHISALLTICPADRVAILTVLGQLCKMSPTQNKSFRRSLRRCVSRLSWAGPNHRSCVGQLLEARQIPFFPGAFGRRHQKVVGLQLGW